MLASKRFFKLEKMKHRDCLYFYQPQGLGLHLRVSRMSWRQEQVECASR